MKAPAVSRGRWERPLAPGLGLVVEGRWGTLGALVRDRLSGTRLLLGSAHVLRPRRSLGAAVWQPAPCDRRGCACNRVGATTRAVQAVVEWDGHHHYIDAAVATLEADVDTVDAGLGIAARPVRGIGVAGLGRRVWKNGAATGHTTGVVLDDRHLETARLWDGNRHAPNQILIRSLPGNAGEEGVDCFASPGDSGALVFEDDHVVGLLWGASRSGEAVACHIGPLLDALAIDLEVQA